MGRHASTRGAGTRNEAAAGSLKSRLQRQIPRRLTEAAVAVTFASTLTPNGAMASHGHLVSLALCALASLLMPLRISVSEAGGGLASVELTGSRGYFIVAPVVLLNTLGLLSAS